MLPPRGPRIFCSCVPQGLLEIVVQGQVLSSQSCKIALYVMDTPAHCKLSGKCSSYCLESGQGARGLLGSVVLG